MPDGPTTRRALQVRTPAAFPAAIPGEGWPSGTGKDGAASWQRSSRPARVGA
jgi:hypothetical protein